MNAILVNDTGAQDVTREQLESLPVPVGTDTWKPIAHAKVLEMVEDNLQKLDLRVASSRFIVAKGGGQFFGTLNLDTEMADGVSLAVGVRNSVDKSLSAGLVVGESVFVCSNLCFSGEKRFDRRHTINVEKDFEQKVVESVSGLGTYAKLISQRIEVLQKSVLTMQKADSTILRAFEKGLILPRQLKGVVKEWRKPSHEEFEPRTKWSLLNAYTEAMKDRQSSQPILAATETMRFRRYMLSV